MAGKFDDAADNARRSFEPLRYSFGSALSAQTLLPIYLTIDHNIRKSHQTIKEYYSNNSIWEENIRLNKHFHGQAIKLNSFFVFEWFPRSPGLYFTNSGREARRDARERIISATGGAIVYDPSGKQSMLDGGVGNFRLRPISINQREFLFVSASDNGICHQGFPIAIPPELFRQCIDEIKGRGAALRTLVGELKFVPKELEDTYIGYTEVKKFYLEVNEINPPEQRKSREYAELQVSVSASFEGIVDGDPGVYATYVTFDPSEGGALKRAVQWMGDEYVAHYNGKVLTDFDEHENHFPTARFSLEKVMKFKIAEKDYHTVQNHVYININNLIAFQEFIKTKYKILGGNIAAIGDEAKASHVNQYASSDSR